jgi:hypothetical protein
MVKPRYEETSSEVQELLMKAIALEKRIDEAEIQKSSHHPETTFDTRPGGVQFMAESGGQTYNAFYNTNQSLLDSDDVANKGASSESINLDNTPMKNTHDTVNRLVEG